MTPRSAQPLASLLLFATLACTGACGAMVTPADGGTDALPDHPLVFPDGRPVLPDVPGTPDAEPPSEGGTCSWAGASNVAITLDGYALAGDDCSSRPNPTPGTGEVHSRNAAVVEVHDDATGTHLTLDFCSPAADCVPFIGHATILAPGFSLAQGPNALRAGQFVQVRTRATWSWGCTTQFELSNIPSWDGEPNHVRSDGALLAAAASGEASALPGVRYGVARQSIGCVNSGPSCGEPPELFALAFQGACNTCIRDPDPVIVRQNTSGQFSIDGATYQATNHRSFASGACDDSWNYAWTVREIWLE